MKPAREILKILESCFDEGELETLIAVADETSRPPGGESVMVIYTPTAAEFVGSGHNQIKNKIAAILQLLEVQLPQMVLGNAPSPGQQVP